MKFEHDVCGQVQSCGIFRGNIITWVLITLEADQISQPYHFWKNSFASKNNFLRNTAITSCTAITLLSIWVKSPILKISASQKS